MSAPKLKCGDVILYKIPTMAEAHPCIVILHYDNNDSYILVNTTSNLSNYPVVNDYLQKGNARCLDEHKIFLFCENGFNRHCIVLLKRTFIEKDFGSDIESARKLFSLTQNKYRALLNCLENSPDVKKYYKRLIRNLPDNN